MGFIGSIKHAWQLFRPPEAKESIDIKEPSRNEFITYQSGSRPYVKGFRTNVDKHLIASILNRIAVDASGIEFNHVILDQNERFVKEVDSELNKCLNLRANIDQDARAFRQDVVATLVDQGVAVIVPVEANENPSEVGSFDPKQLRVGTVIEWSARYVRVRLWNDQRGIYEELQLPKSIVAIIENPFYSIMNEPNSTLKRLLAKFNALDVIDSELASGKLNIIVQVPYSTRNETRKTHARERVSDIEFQISHSPHGIVYMDAAEKIIPLSKSYDNSLLSEITFLTEMLYSQLGVTPAILNGTASEQEMLNYNNRVLKPMVQSISQAMTYAFLTKKARTQGHAVTFFRDPFELVPLSSMADIANTFSRNEILTPNEIRSIIGMRPSEQPDADLLKNRNMPSDDFIQPNFEGEYPSESIDYYQPDLTEESQHEI